MEQRLYRSRIEAWKHSPGPARLEREIRGEVIDQQVVLRDCFELSIWPDAQRIMLKGVPLWEQYERPRGKRAKIGGFTYRSRRNMQCLLATIRRDAVALFVTLTYPSTWASDPKEWKRHLDVFGKWLCRNYPKASAIWKLEAQQRGAPHFHLMVFGIEFLPHGAVARRWFEIVGSNDPAHIAAGVQVVRVKSHRGVMRYASKIYMGKEVKDFVGVGRFWGVVARQKLPTSNIIKGDIPRPIAIWIRRFMRRSLRARGVHISHLNDYFCNDPKIWARAIELAWSLHDERLQKMALPF
ncbi:MAG: hypothetical protein QM796_02465 [Chthoniobacteraceae bacterium]